MAPTAFKLESLTDVEKTAVENLREYIRIPSVHPNPNYESCVDFLRRLAKDVDLQFNIYRQTPTKPVIILSWIGNEPQLPSIMLNSHMDVVPVLREQWIHDPFGAHLDEEGNIFGRGTQDTKIHGIEYIEAIRKLKKEGQVPKRTVHVSFVPDEEIGGHEGMASFVKSQEFKNLNVDFALDEGMPGEGDLHWAANGERSAWNYHVHIPGTSGHGSLLLDDTPGEKLSYLLTKVYELRKKEKAKVTDIATLGMVTSINVTVLKGGVQNNVIPSEFIVSFDARIPPDVGIVAFEEQFLQWCKEAGDGIWIEDVFKDDVNHITAIDDTNPYWAAFKGAMEGMNLKLKPFILFGAVDARFLRKVGVNAIDYSANQDTPPRHHSNNEFINVKIFLRAIDIYSKIILALGNA